MSYKEKYREKRMDEFERAVFLKKLMEATLFTLAMLAIIAIILGVSLLDNLTATGLVLLCVAAVFIGIAYLAYRVSEITIDTEE